MASACPAAWAAAHVELLTKITEGQGSLEDIDEIEKLAEGMTAGSLCSLGQLTPGPIIGTLRYFRDEFVAHVTEGRCPAKQCTALVQYYVNPETCKGCGICAQLPRERHRGRPSSDPHHRPGRLHQVRHLPRGLPVRLDPEGFGRAGRVPAELMPIGTWKQ